MISVESGIERFAREINLDDYYSPYPMQARFHASPTPHKLLGGAAGPGKTLALIVEHMIAANEFTDPVAAKQVHTLLLRRTHPKLEATLITRFREKIPRELYRDFNESKKVVTWHNGATTHFGSMQYEHNAWDWQGQWYKIGYDEVCEFTYKQWQATSAWNRCPVSPHCTKDGAGNPIGIGAGWCKKLFVDKVPCDEMDEAQRSRYRPEDYEYFPCTYLDNPIYANDPAFIARLESYPAAIRDALKYGTWGVVGGYFFGAWDPAENVYDPDAAEGIKPWHKRWISTDWGFEHWAATYWHYMDDLGIIRTYRELCVKHQPPEVLAESIARASLDADGPMPKFQAYFLSHDAFASKATSTMGENPNSVAMRMAPVLRQHGLPAPTMSTRDKLGREQLMYQLLRKRVRVGETADGQPVQAAAWQIADTCSKLIDVIPAAPRDEDDVERIAEFLGDDPLQGAGYGLYGITGKPGKKPDEQKLQEQLSRVEDPFAQKMVIFKHNMTKLKKAERDQSGSPAWMRRVQ